jgi:hypothetical protein
MRKTKITMQLDRAIRHIVILMQLVFLLPSAFGQVVRLTSKPRPSFIGGNSLTVTASSTSVSFSLVAQGTATASSAINISVGAASATATTTTVNVYGFFASATSALTGEHSGAVIPSSAVLGKTTNGLLTSFTPFTQSAPFGGAGAGVKLVSDPVTFIVGDITDIPFSLNLEINLAGHVLPADIYTGTLMIQAQDM